jgi:hypothetical protein
MLILYTFFLLKGNLLQVNALVFFLPLISMIISIIIINHRTKLDLLPGFGRITSLFMLLLASFILALILQRTRIWILFRGPFQSYLIMVGVLFLFMHFAARKLFKRDKKT